VLIEVAEVDTHVVVLENGTQLVVVLVDLIVHQIQIL
jgi:hypothetical protein